MSDDVYCSMIHGGLNINIKNRHAQFANHCCLRHDPLPIDLQNVWNNDRLIALRQTNLDNKWDAGCSNCELLENAGLVSFRQGMNNGLGIVGKKDLSGPARLDLMFDVSCNLACRTCGPHASSYWQHHLKVNGQWSRPIRPEHNADSMIALLQTLNLENLRQVVFCGGETLLGNEYWNVARWLTANVPNAKSQLTLCFQTNGTQPIEHKNFEIINECHAVRLHVSMDAVGQQFEYLRWPASWEQVTTNLFDLKSTVPSNVLFLIEQTVSIFNILHLHELDQWCNTNFSANREGDSVQCTKHLATGIYSLTNASQPLINALDNGPYRSLVPVDWKENAQFIRSMLDQIKKFDQFRNQSFEQTFPATFAAFKEFW